MAQDDKSCVAHINNSDYLDLAVGEHHIKTKAIERPLHVRKARSWTPEHREHLLKGKKSGQDLEDNKVTLAKVKSLPLRIRVFENPLVSLDSIGMMVNHQDVLRSFSLMTNPRTMNTTPASPGTGKGIRTIIEMKKSSEVTKVHFNTASHKYNKFNKKDIREITDPSTLSPVRRKIAKATENVLEQEEGKSSPIIVATAKRPSVVFKLMEEGDLDVLSGEDSPGGPRNSFVRRMSQFGARGPRPSIFSILSQVAGRAHRPSIFSRLSDFSVGSFTTSNYSWNYKKIFLFIFTSFSLFIVFSFLLVVFWPTIEDLKDTKSTFRHI